MKKFAVAFMLFMACYSAQAVDPATVTAAAPKALELATIWSPHAASTLQSTGIGLMKIGESTVSILLLPAGILQWTLKRSF